MYAEHSAGEDGALYGVLYVCAVTTSLTPSNALPSTPAFTRRRSVSARWWRSSSRRAPRAEQASARRPPPPGPRDDADHLQHAPLYMAVVLAAAGAGMLLAWWLRRYTTLSIRNLYLAALLASALDAWALSARAVDALVVLAPVTSFTLAASAIGRRWRLSDLGAGEELRAHERARRWLWQLPAARADGERVHLATQGQIVRQRPWPDSEP
jgi:hypothetical protein